MTRGKLLFMFGGLCVVAILLWIASMLQPQTGPSIPSAATRSSVPTTGDLYVGGHVNHPGMYTIRLGETIKDALASAGGADSAASDLIISLTRKVQDNPSTIRVPMPEILSGATDQKVQPGDVIDVVLEARPTTLQVSPAPAAVPGVTIP